MRAPSSPDRIVADADAPSGGPSAPHVALMLIEVANFAAVRRHRGAREAAELVGDLAAALAALCPEGQVGSAGRALLEVAIRAPAREAAVGVVDRVRGHLAALAQAEAPLETKVGIAVALGQALDDPDLIDAAEAALLRERSGATSSDETIDPQELESAIERGELFLHYQPKLNVRKQAIASVEALVRWRHPERGLVMPSIFIPAAERSGAIGALTLWTLRQVIADQQVMAAAGFDLPVYVNIAGALLSDQDFVAEVLALIGPKGDRLGFEITETSVIDEPERAIDHLHQFANKGISIAIDDYGAGLSSLAYLKQLPARELKIDKLFVTQLASSHRDPLIVRSTIDLAHALEMEVVAEGVETPTSLALLSVMGCDLVQGYLISRPLPLDALLTYLREEGHRAATEQARAPFGRFWLVKKA